MASIGEATNTPTLTGAFTFNDPVDPGQTVQQQVAFPAEFPYAPRVVVTLQSDAPIALFFGVSGTDELGFLLSCLNDSSDQQQPTVTWFAQ